MGELQNLSSNQIALLDHCQELVSTIVAMQEIQKIVVFECEFEKKIVS
ncbi:hypothetical protein V6Z11_D10G191700 [Gossypium hirsutum]